MVWLPVLLLIVCLFAYFVSFVWVCLLCLSLRLTKNVDDSFLIIHGFKSNSATLFALFGCLVCFVCLLYLISLICLALLRLLGLPGYNARLDLVDFTCPGLAAVS